MSDLDDELRNALRREEPPPGFAERVMARVQSAPPPARRWWMLPQLRWAAVAAAVIVLAGGVGMERQRRLRAEGELARDQVMLALRITGSKLQFVKEKINAIDTTQR